MRDKNVRKMGDHSLTPVQVLPSVPSTGLEHWDPPGYRLLLKVPGHVGSNTKQSLFSVHLVSGPMFVTLVSFSAILKMIHLDQEKKTT